MHELAPILVSVYTRIDHFRRCITALQANDLAAESVLYVASDGAANEKAEDSVSEIRCAINNIVGFKDVIPLKRSTNWGAARNSAEARNFILGRHSAYIRLEDDIVTSRSFLRFLNEGLDQYRDDNRILAICAYSLPIKIPLLYKHDIYLGSRFSPWGFAMWKDRVDGLDLAPWDRYSKVMADRRLEKKFMAVGSDILGILKEDSEGKISATDVRLCYQQIMRGQYCVFPVKSLSQNIGMDGSGMHCGISSRFSVPIDNDAHNKIRWNPIPKPNIVILKRFRLYEDGFSSIWSLLIYKLRRILRGIYKRSLFSELFLNSHNGTNCRGKTK